ncbi:MAG TPA: amino acid adenylation domain-containing protein [Acidimicrobiia bacterium]|nr:amino acid adenylation domain-containing protein [Acidimicrobiia bacterium]
MDTLTAALAQTASLGPDRPAVRCNGEELTYAALHERSSRLAWTLEQHGVERGDRVGLLMNKGLESVVAVYGIMRAGAAYVPLDPFAPAQRAAEIMSDCGIRVLVTKPGNERRIRPLVGQVDLDTVIGLEPSDDLGVTCVPWDRVLDTTDDRIPDTRVSAEDLAYILYTSGSTGTPKGIMHSHASAMSFARWAAEEFSLTPEDRVTSHAPLHFDLSTFDLYSTMLAGGTVVIVPESVAMFPASHSQLLQDESITVSYTVPFALMQLMERGAIDARDLSALRAVVFAGEVFPTKHLRALMERWPEKRFSNLFGPTETNVCTFYHVPEPPSTDDPIPIGVVCPTDEALIVDRDDRPVPKGEVGELLVGGGTVMRGYWGGPDMDDSSFVHLSSGGPKRRFYRTGDLVAEGPDGNLRYLGRKDRQVKTRGFRVELDEVEVALLSHEAVAEAASYVVPDGAGSSLIEAAVVLERSTMSDEASLMSHVAAQLPSYAVPSAIHVVESLPRTSTGKIDRQTVMRVAGRRPA